METTTKPSNTAPNYLFIISRKEVKLCSEEEKGGKTILKQLIGFLIIDCLGSFLNLTRWAISSQANTITILARIIGIGAGAAFIMKKVDDLFEM